METLITRAEARVKGLKRYFTGKPCVNGHTSERQVSSGDCLSCACVRKRTAYAKYPEKFRNISQYNRDLFSERINRLRRRSYAVSPPVRVYGLRDRVCVAKRRAAILQQFPVWISDEEERGIREIYLAADLISEMHQLKMHVDHTIPLQGKMVSGLHTLKNLQILPADENLRKSNKFEA